jgi:DNA-binding response OmpR family regulator
MERMILTSLLTKEGTVVNHADILHAIGRDKSKKSLHSLSAAVCNLRKKHSALFKIFNVKGLGYGALKRNSDIMRHRQS